MRSKGIPARLVLDMLALDDETVAAAIAEDDGGVCGYGPRRLWACERCGRTGIHHHVPCDPAPAEFVEAQRQRCLTPSSVAELAAILVRAGLVEPPTRQSWWRSALVLLPRNKKLDTRK